MTHSGIFNLRSPRDLLEKARFDLERLRKNPISTYAAFDFFVTVRHIPDWLHPDQTESSKRNQLFASSVELRIARHIADGAKHFLATDKRHQQVKGSTRTVGAFDPGFFSDAFHVGRLTVTLDSKDQDTAPLGTEIDVLPLAERVFKAIEQLVV